MDLIIGKKVKGREKHYYVREPEKRTTYIAEMDVKLSAKFGDWIEPDLLKVSQNEIVRLTVDNYSVDEQRRALVQGDVLPFLKDGLKSTGKWTLEGLDAEKEKVDESVVNEIARNIDQLKIVGVRPKPEGLGADLTVSDEIKSNPLIRQVLESEMRRQGFFVAVANGEEKLVSNEGEILAGTDNGVKYTLYFGEIASGSSKDVEVGLAEKAEASEEKTETGEPKEETPAKETPADKDAQGPRRYMLVKVEFDESLLGPEPQAPVEPVMPEILKESTAPAEATPAPAESTPAPDAATPGTPSNECGPQEQEPAPEQQPTEPPAAEQR